MNIFEAIWPVPGPLAAALVAGIISFVITVLSKDQKTSEFRQAWIDGLRTDVADFAGITGAMAAVTNAKHLRGDDANAYLLERHDDFAKMQSLITKIRLRLNPDEHSETLAALGLFGEGSSSTKEQIDKAVEDVVTTSQKILKSEWSRVKRGEPAFMWLKRISLSLIVAAPIFALILAFNAPSSSAINSKPPDLPASTATPKTQPLAPSSSG
ncbi:hypothetical protein [Pseudomonas sp. B22129]|uniref:hypothetical protein n=1 Tax=Pseudomonas sp. B22129 TaxID=3235111 RepID=UPI0037849AD4